MLVKYKKSLEFRLLPTSAHTAGFDGVDVVAGLGETLAQLLGGGGGMNLLLHAPALIGQLDDELCHSLPRYQLAGREIP